MATLKEDVAELKDQLAVIAKKLGDMGTDETEVAKTEVKDYLDKASKHVQDKWEDGSQKTKEAADKVQKYAEEHPWQVAGAAAAAGLIAAAVTMLNKSDDQDK